ncbi:MAG: cytochrome c oxidase assembly protein [Gemmatimonadaceae bacterium]
MRARLGTVNVAGLTAALALALAHPGKPPEPHDLWTSWTFDPAVIVLLAVGASAYARGMHVLWRRGAPGGGGRRGVRRWQATAMAAGLGSLAVALISPLDALAEALLSAHMVQHLLLMLVAAPLLAAARPLQAVLWALPAAERLTVGRWWNRSTGVRTTARALTHPLVAWTLHSLALWVWHAPGPYDAAVRHDALHALEHASFFGTAMLFWWPIMDAAHHRPATAGLQALSVFTVAMQSTVLGALLTLSHATWYTAHLATTGPWGLSPAEDQQLAGAIMWVPGSGAYLFAVAILARRWLRTPSRAAAALATR